MLFLKQERWTPLPLTSNILSHRTLFFFLTNHNTDLLPTNLISCGSFQQDFCLLSIFSQLFVAPYKLFWIHSDQIIIYWFFKKALNLPNPTIWYTVFVQFSVQLWFANPCLNSSLNVHSVPTFLGAPQTTNTEETEPPAISVMFSLVSFSWPVLPLLSPECQTKRGTSLIPNFTFGFTSCVQ